MPDYPSTSKKFLNEQETILACNRLAMDGIALTQGAHEKGISHWEAFKMCVIDWRTWAQCLLLPDVFTVHTYHPYIRTHVGWLVAV